MKWKTMKLCYVDILCEKTRGELIGNLALARDFLEQKFVEQNPKVRLSRNHIEKALDIICKISTYS